MSETVTLDSLGLVGSEGDERLQAVVVSGPVPRLHGRVVSLRKVSLFAGPLCVGRGDGAELAVRDPRVSRRHAIFEWDELASGPVVADLSSRNGTYVDGRRVPRARLRAGSVVRMGDTCLVVDRVIKDGSATGNSAMVGSSAAVRTTRASVEKVAPTSLMVLVTGETGTGKEVVASQVHFHSGRSGAFVPVNCAAVPEALAESTFFGHLRGAFTGAADRRDGCFVQAHGGTLFLDEVGELPAAMQAKLLRVLEDFEVTPVGSDRSRRVDVRIVAATNVDLHQAVEDGGFRADLLARLEEWPIVVAPLRERRVDIIALTTHFLADGQRTLSADAAEALLLHEWPFNVRELKKLCRRLGVAVAPGEVVGLDDLGESMVQLLRRCRLDEGEARSALPEGEAAAPAGPPAGEVSREAMETALRAVGGNVSRAARRLEIPRRTMYRRLEAFGIDPAAYRD